MKYIIEVEVDRALEESVFDCEKECQREKCPFWSDTGDSFIDGCSIDLKNSKKCIVKIQK